MVACFRSAAHLAICRPRTVLALAAAATLAAGAGLPQLTLRTDGHALVSPDAPEVVQDQAIRERFGLEDQIVVLIQSSHPDGIFNPGTVQLVRDLTAELKRLPGINPASVLSLATEPSFRLRPGTLINQTLLEPPLKTRAELDLLREDLRRIELYTGTLVSFDGRSTAVMVGTPAGADRTRLYEQVLGRIAALGSVPEDIAVTGAPVAEALLGIHILEDLGVPAALLGTSTRSHKETSVWKRPASLHELRLLLARKIGLVPVALLVMMAVFLVAFRNIVALLLPLLEVAATLAFVFGLLGWFGVPVYLTLAVTPVLLTAMCVTDEIHLFGRYATLLREQSALRHPEVVRQTLDDMVSPIVSTSLTTAIGFAAFAFSPLPPVRAFGIFTGLGVLFAMLYSLTVIPAMLVLTPTGPFLSRRPAAAAAGLAAAFGRLAVAVARHRWWAIGTVLLVMALSPLGLRRLTVQDSWIDGFDPDSEFRRATKMVNEQYFGMHLLLVTLDAPAVATGEIPIADLAGDEIRLPANLVEHPALIAGSPITLTRVETDHPERPASAPPWRSRLEMVTPRGDQMVARFPHGSAATNPRPPEWQTGRVRFEMVAQSHLRPDLIRLSGELASFIRERRQDSVGGVLGPYEYILTTRFMARPNDPAARQLPGDAGEIKLMWDFYGLARGRERLRQIVDSNFWQSVTTVFLKDANFRDTARLMRDLREFERERLSPAGIKLGLGGDVAVSQSLIQGIVATQLKSLGWALAGICLVTALFVRSLRWGLLCVLPSAVAVLVNFGLMGWVGIPLGVATSMFAGMTLGLGVDFAIHFFAGHELARAAGAAAAEASRRAMAFSGPPVLINTLAIALGFGVMLLSQVPANARLGALLVLAMVNCLLASLLLLPALLDRRRPTS